MTIENENSYRELTWTGVETSFNPQFRAEREEDVSVQYQADDGDISDLTLGVHFDVSLDGDNNVTVTPLTMPAATAGAPGTLLIERNTRALQPTDFQDLEDFPASDFTFLFDRLTMLAGEFRRAIARAIGPFVTVAGVVDFRPYRIKAADPVDDADVATKLWVLTVTGILNLTAQVAAAAASAAAAAASLVSTLTAQTASEAARDRAQAWSDTAENTPVTGAEYSAFHWSQKSAAAAASVLAALAVTDYGFVTDAPTETRDYGTIP